MLAYSSSLGLCRKNWENPFCSRIVDLAKEFSFGTRLTGAGWGGCTVSLVAPQNVEKFTNALIQNFYKPLGVTDGFESIVFTTAPKGGACIYSNSG